MQTVHATCLTAGTVVREAADGTPALQSSYRVVGRISDDAALLRHWLLGQALVAHGATVRA